jgi:glycosyltransferase involved in cell wall biosynthesis
MRTSFGFPPDALVLFTSSRLEKKNGVTDVVSALALLPAHVCFVVCGSGSLQETIQSQVAAQGLQNRVKFMGFVDPKELPLLMRASDIFIRPSLSEGLGNAFLEAMASDMITIGTNAGGIPDFLTDGETGFLVEIENPQSIVDTVLKIESLHESTKEAILSRAKALVLEKYNWDVVTKDMRSMFKNIVDAK